MQSKLRIIRESINGLINALECNKNSVLSKLLKELYLREKYHNDMMNYIMVTLSKFDNKNKNKNVDNNFYSEFINELKLPYLLDEIRVDNGNLINNLIVDLVNINVKYILEYSSSLIDKDEYCTRILY